MYILNVACYLCRFMYIRAHVSEVNAPKQKRKSIFSISETEEESGDSENGDTCARGSNSGCKCVHLCSMPSMYLYVCMYLCMYVYIYVCTSLFLACMCTYSVPGIHGFIYIHAYRLCIS